jgi:uncharacterized protein YjiS (DUF1127 family)
MMAAYGVNSGTASDACFHQARSVSAAAFASRTGRLLLRLVLAPVRFYRARARFAELAALTDLQLRDIGLMRQDIANASALPRDVDPTPELAKLVESRRRVGLGRMR